MFLFSKSRRTRFPVLGKVALHCADGKRTATTTKHPQQLCLLFLVLFVYLLSTGTLFAEESAATHKEATEVKVGEIIFDLPQDVNDPDFLARIKDLRDTLQLHTGDPYNPAKIQEVIRLLYRSDLFSQIQAFGDRHDDHIALRFFLLPQTIIDKIEFQGQKALDASRLSRALRIKPGDRSFSAILEQEAKRIEMVYIRAGYPRAKISFLQQPSLLAYRTIVHFNVVEGEPLTLTEVDFVGDLHFKENRLQNKFPMKKGELLDLDLAFDGVKELQAFYRREGFEEARIELIGADEKKLNSSLFMEGHLVLRIQAGRKTEIRFVGNERYSPNELKAALRLEEEELVSYGFANLTRLARRLGDFYRREGYLNARVSHRTAILGPRLQRVEFLITEGKRIKLKAVCFEGLRQLAEKDLNDELFAVIRDQLSTGDEGEAKKPDSGDFVFDPYRFEDAARERPRRSLPAYARPERLSDDEVYIPDVFQEAIQSVEQYCRSLGFLSCRIGAPKLEYNLTGQRLVLHYPVEEGPQTLIHKTHWVGVKTLSAPQMEVLAPLAPGTPLNPQSFEAIGKTIREEYAKSGHIYSQVDISYTLSHDAQSADVLLAVYEGPQVKVGEIALKGINITKPKTVIDELAFEKGDVYKPADMLESQRWLQRMGIFQSVTLRPWEPEKEEEVKDVVVSVLERKPGRVEVSGGLATDDGVRLGLNFVYRNLLGSALEFHTKLKINHRIPAFLDSQFAKLYEDLSFDKSLERDVTLGIFYPSILGSHIGFRADFVHLREQERACGLDKNAFMASFETEVLRYLTLSLINEFSYLNSKRTTLPSLDDREIIPPDGLTWEYSPKFQFLLDYRDNLFNPTYGVVVSGLMEYFETIEGSKNFDLFRGSGSIASYIPIPITRNPVVLKFSFRTGGIAMASGGESPVHKRFKLGGRSSLRGFDEESVYPQDLSAAQITDIRQKDTPSPGGNFYMLFKTDLRIPIYKNYYLGGFVDSGSLWLDVKNANLDLRQYKHAAGGGLHYRTPVGDISLEFGWNLIPDKELKEAPWRFHFSISLF